MTGILRMIIISLMNCEIVVDLFVGYDLGAHRYEILTIIEYGRIKGIGRKTGFMV